MKRGGKEDRGGKEERGKKRRGGKEERGGKKKKKKWADPGSNWGPSDGLIDTNFSLTLSQLS